MLVVAIKTSLLDDAHQPVPTCPHNPKAGISLYLSLAGALNMQACQGHCRLAFGAEKVTEEPSTFGDALNSQKSSWCWVPVAAALPKSCDVDGSVRSN